MLDNESRNDSFGVSFRIFGFSENEKRGDDHDDGIVKSSEEESAEQIWSLRTTKSRQPFSSSKQQDKVP